MTTLTINLKHMDWERANQSAEFLLANQSSSLEPILTNEETDQVWSRLYGYSDRTKNLH